MPDKPAAQAEAEGDETVAVDYGEETYMFPASLDDADGDILEAIDDMKLSYAVKALLGPEQWKRFKATKPKVRDYAGLFDAFAKGIGLESVGG